MEKIGFKKLHENALKPTYATEGAACFDLYAMEHIGPINAPRTVRTGIAFEVPAGYVMLIFSRSGHGFKNCVRLANCVGVIDSDYRGEVMVKLTRDEGPSLTLEVRAGDRIAQAMLVPVFRPELEERDDLSATARGEGGFGSTGA